MIYLQISLEQNEVYILQCLNSKPLDLLKDGSVSSDTETFSQNHI